jgi:hypothetical protein
MAPTLAISTFLLVELGFVDHIYSIILNRNNT